MIKPFRLILILLIITSCNSNEKKSIDISQNQKHSKLETSIKQGRLVYDDMRITCHLTDCKGVPKTFPL